MPKKSRITLHFENASQFRMPSHIEKLDHQDPAVKERLREFLAPHEVHALFILGNLRSIRPQTNMYVAIRDGLWVGVCGYYGVHQSMNPFSTDPQVARQLVRHTAGLHPIIEYLTGIDYAAQPALEELQSLGYQCMNDPHQVFMELGGQPPPQEAEAQCRQMAPDDAEQVVRLLRVMWDEDPATPITQEELDRVRLNPARWVLEADGRIVSTAATSGIGISACQIIGVATDPNHRRKGYARAVCAHLIRQMAAKGAQQTVLFTDVGNLAAQRCYQGLGFRIAGKYYVAKFKPKE